MARQNNKLPFALAYLDWCKEVKRGHCVKDAERKDWIREFYYSSSWREKPVCISDLMIANGGKI